MTGLEAARGEKLPRLLGKAQEAKRVRDGRAVTAHLARDLFLGQPQVLLEPLEGLRLLEGDSSSRWMFSTRASSRSRSSATSRTVTGTVASPACCAARQRRSPAMIWYPLGRPPHQDGLDDPALPDRGRELLEARGVHPRPRLEGVGLELAHRRPRPSTPVAVPSSGSGRSADSPLPSAFRFGFWGAHLDANRVSWPWVMTSLARSRYASAPLERMS